MPDRARSVSTPPPQGGGHEAQHELPVPSLWLCRSPSSLPFGRRGAQRPVRGVGTRRCTPTSPGQGRTVTSSGQQVPQSSRDHQAPAYKHKERMKSNGAHQNTPASSFTRKSLVRVPPDSWLVQRLLCSCAQTRGGRARRLLNHLGSSQRKSFLPKHQLLCRPIPLTQTGILAL